MSTPTIPKKNAILTSEPTAKNSSQSNNSFPLAEKSATKSDSRVPMPESPNCSLKNCCQTLKTNSTKVFIRCISTAKKSLRSTHKFNKSNPYWHLMKYRLKKEIFRWAMSYDCSHWS